MSQTIPTQALPYYSQVTRLDDADFTLEFRYSTREQRYYFNLYDAANVLLCAGIKLVSNWPLLHYYKFRAGVPRGEIMVTAIGADSSSPKLGDLGVGKRCQLTYFTAAEASALGL